MKNKCGSLGFVFFLLITACTPKVEVSSNISTTLMDRTWRITYFVDSTENETSHFNGFGFVFAADQVLVAIKDSITINGQWHTGDDNDLTNLIIDFAEVENFRDLNNDWDAFEIKDDEVKLRLSNNTGIDFLTLTKN
jgi:hypothetical protein